MKHRRYLLDTNVLIAMFRGNQKVRSMIIKVGFENCCVSEISIAELFYGAAKGGRKSNLEDVQNVMRQFEIIPIFPALEDYGNVKAALEKDGNRIDDFDLLIAASALCNHMTVVTANIKHFARVKGLAVEDWENAV